MEGLLTLFVAVTAVAVILQACVLVAIYMIAKNLAGQADRFMKDMRELMVPVRSITENIKTVSEELIEMGMSAKEQMRHVEAMITDAGEKLQIQLERFDRVGQTIAQRIDETAEIVQDSIISPVREVSAFAKGIGRGLSFFFRRKNTGGEFEEEDLSF